MALREGGAWGAGSPSPAAFAKASAPWTLPGPGRQGDGTLPTVPYFRVSARGCSPVCCQLAYAQSLREFRGGLAALEGKLRHLGVMDCPKATTLSYANAHRPWRLHETLFYQTLACCQAEAALSAALRT